MVTLKSTLKAFARDERGNSALEYCAILSFIGGTLLIALPLISSGFEAQASTIGSALNAPVAVSDSATTGATNTKACSKASGGGSSSRSPWRR